jgi:4-amino-4-deoxy-L-arabinose transferase-like glycosyltransferase
MIDLNESKKSTQVVDNAVINPPHSVNASGFSSFWAGMRPWLDIFKSNAIIATIFISCVLLIFFNELGFGTNVLEPSEGFYAEGAREMLESGNYLTPHMNYEVWLEKPPLIYWMIATSYKMFGVNPFAARFPESLCSVLLVSAVFLITRRFVNKRAAFCSASILAASPLFAVVGRLSVTDVPLTAFTGLALLGLFATMQTKRVSIALCSYLFLSLAVLSKGPLALVLTGAVLVSYLAIVSPSLSKFWQNILKLRPLLGLAILCVVAVPWFVIDNIATNGELVNEFFIKQNLGRFRGTVDHQHAFWFYIPFVLGGFAPWLLIGALPGALLTKAFQQVKRFRRAQANLTTRQQLMIFGATWALVIYLLLSIVQTKLATYIVPMFAGLAITFGIACDTFLKKPWQTKFINWTGPVLCVVSIVAIIVLQFFLHLPMRIALTMTPYIAVLAAMSGVYWYLLWSGRSRAALVQLFIFTTFGVVALVPQGCKVTYLMRQEPLQVLLEKCEGSNANVASVGGKCMPTAAFYLKKRVPVVRDKEQMQAFLKTPQSPHYLLVSKKILYTLNWTDRPTRNLGRGGNWYLFAVD